MNIIYFSVINLVDPSLMIVTWVTLNEVNDSIVEYGQFDMLEKRAIGYVSIFQDDGSEQRREYIHRVVLHDLIPGQKYCIKYEKRILIDLSFFFL